MMSALAEVLASGSRPVVVVVGAAQGNLQQQRKIDRQSSRRKQLNYLLLLA